MIDKRKKFMYFSVKMANLAAVRAGFPPLKLHKESIIDQNTKARKMVNEKVCLDPLMMNWPDQVHKSCLV